MSLKYFKAELMTHDLVQDLKWDTKLRQQFETDEATVLDQYDLTDQERTAIEQRDFRALYELGVHPYMLAQLARLVFGTVEGAGSSTPAQALVDSLLGTDKARQ